jgi:hypothetical protein
LRLQKHHGSLTAVFVAAIAALSTASARAQVVEPVTTPALAAPWSWQHVFEPVPFAKRWETNRRLEGLEEILPEDTPVRTRQQPGYEPVGIRAGSWMFHPSLGIASLYNSNVFASNTDKRSDFALQVQPSLNLQTLWDRHFIDIQADMLSQFYRNNPGLDQTDASLRARTRIDLRHDMMILASVRAAHLNEAVGSLTSPAGAVEPTPYDVQTGDATYVQQLGRLTASAGVRVASYDFGSTRAQNGTTISQSSRDGQVYSGHTRLEYVFSPKLGFFGALDVNRRELRGTPTQSFSSDGYRTLAGVNVELTHLIRGEFAAGYAEQKFDAATIANIAGPTYRVLLTWSPTRSLDVHFKAEHAVTDVVETAVTGVRADALQVGFDYELRRNVVFSAAGIYEQDRFFGQPREDNVYSSLAEIKYLLNRYGSVSLQHQYTRRDSNNPTFGYDRHEVTLGATVKF